MRVGRSSDQARRRWGRGQGPHHQQLPCCLSCGGARPPWWADGPVWGLRPGRPLMEVPPRPPVAAMLSLGPSLLQEEKDRAGGRRARFGKWAKRACTSWDTVEWEHPRNRSPRSELFMTSGLWVSCGDFCLGWRTPAFPPATALPAAQAAAVVRRFLSKSSEGYLELSDFCTSASISWISM